MPLFENEARPYRELLLRAEQLRYRASEAPTPRVREKLSHLAGQYEAMARRGLEAGPDL
ncbi:hypothetical protein GGQ87_000111 [Brevundimonas alba]|uniref:Uncharacterized protein n=1 Tax=Brevundimonas alba TaxID=74314 RepID=A0A7X5YHI8_9CAUL|nr:hypothetical protein [Brevundimonas alba]NJC39853.1 hypothetical protein [Brevundimonas alba]